MKKLFIFNQYLYLLIKISIYYIIFFTITNIYCNILGIRNIHTSTEPDILVNKPEKKKNKNKNDKDLSFNQ